MVVDDFKCLPVELIFNIISYNDECTSKISKGRIIIYEPKYKLILTQLNKICSITDHCNVKSWRSFNHNCMKILYKKCNIHDFHLLLNELEQNTFISFVEIETVNMLHHLSLIYYHLLRYIYDTNYPILTAQDKKIVYGIFWDYCKFYFMLYKGLNPIENSFLL